MKKILLMLAMLLPCVGAWAEVAPLKVSTDTEKFYYVIKNFRSHKFAYYNGDAAQLGQQTNPTSTTTQENLDKYLWYVTEASGEGAYMLHNVATNKVYAAYNSFTDAGAVVYIKENPYKAGYVCVSSNADAKTKDSCWDDQGSQTKIGPYETRQNDNEGTSWEFIEITPNTEVSYTLNDVAGNNFSGTFTGWSKEMLPVFTGVAGYSLSNVVFANNEITATITFPFPVSKVDDTTNWTFIYTGTVSQAIPYLYVNGSGKVVSKSNNASNGTLGYLPTGADGEVQKWMWAIYPSLTEGNFTFTIKNAATNKFVPGGNATTTVIVSDEAGVYSWGPCTNSKNGFYLANNTNVYFGANSGSPGEQAALLWNKNSSHQGCNLEFTAPVYTANCTLTDNSGIIYSLFTTIAQTEDNSDTERPVITGIPTSLLTNEKWNEGAYSATVNLPFATSNTTIVNPTMISSFANSSFKWFTNGTDIKSAKNVGATSSNIAAHLWIIYPTCEDGAFSFQIKNLATDTYIYTNSTANSHNSGAVTLSETATNFTFDNSGFKFPSGNNNFRYLSSNSSNVNNGVEQIVGTWAHHGGCNLAFPTTTYSVEVTSTEEVGPTGKATLYSPIAGAFDGDVKTYAIESASNNSATLVEKTGVAANQGAIIEATPGTYTFTAGEVSSDWNSNLLTGSSVNTLVNESAYVLARVDGKAVLALAKLNKDVTGATGTTHFLNNAGKAYLPASAVSTTAQVLRFNLGGTTAIESVLNNGADANAPIYDLSGRRVNNAVKGGIYIQNGKKFIVK